MSRRTKLYTALFLLFLLVLVVLSFIMPGDHIWEGFLAGFLVLGSWGFCFLATNSYWADKADD